MTFFYCHDVNVTIQIVSMSRCECDNPDCQYHDVSQSVHVTIQIVKVTM